MKPRRLMESQDRLREVMAEAMGIYMAKEPTEKDGWRHKNLWELMAHLAHEVGEIRHSSETDRIYHNSLDAVILAAMIAVRVREEYEKDKDKDKNKKK